MVIAVFFYCDTGLVTQWYSSSGSSYSPYVRGGIQYSNGIATVPRDGLYYVYVQMRFYSHPSYSSRGLFCVAINGSCQFFSYTITQDKDDLYTPYSGRSLLLKNKDQLSVRFSISNTNFHFSSQYTFFGAFLI